MQFARVTFITPIEDPGKPSGIHRREFSAPEYLLELEGDQCSVTHAASGEQRITNVHFFATPVKPESMPGAKVEAVWIDEASSLPDALSAVPPASEQTGKKRGKRS